MTASVEIWKRHFKLQNNHQEKSKQKRKPRASRPRRLPDWGLTSTAVPLLPSRAARAEIVELGVRWALQWDLETSLQWAEYSRLLHGPEALSLVFLQG